MGRKATANPEDFAQVNVRMLVDFKTACDKKAEEEGTSLNEWIRRAMKDRLNGRTSNASLSRMDVDNLMDKLMTRVYREFEERGYTFDLPDAENQKLRNATIEFITNQTAQRLRRKYVNCQIHIPTILNNERRGTDEGYFRISVTDDSGKILELAERAIPSKEIDAKIAKHGREIWALEKFHEEDRAE